MNQALANM